MERYCFYCDAYRERPRCEACGWTTYSMKTPAPSELPKEWRPDAGRAALEQGS